MFKLVIVLAAVAATQALVPTGYGGYAVPSISATGSNIHRSFGNVGQVAHQAKSIVTPFSAVHQADSRVSNPGYRVAAPIAAYGGYHAPLATAAYGAPLAAAAYGGYHAPLAAAAYRAPIAAPAVAGGLLGVAYSAAPVVSHMTYSSGLGYNYAW